MVTSHLAAATEPQGWKLGGEQHVLLMYVAGNTNVDRAENVARWAQYLPPTTRLG